MLTPAIRLLVILCALQLGLPMLASALPANLEIRQTNAVSPPFSRYVYICPTCTEADHLSISDPPFGDPTWERARPKVQVFTSGSAIFPTPPPGVAASVDAVTSIPGDEYLYVAEVLDGTIIGFDPLLDGGEFLALTHVKRRTQMKWAPGTVVHELTNPGGDSYVLFTFASELLGTFDVETEGGLASFSGVPVGWTYSSQTLTETFKMHSGGVATVLASGSFASWQLIQNVPEPAGLAVATALCALGAGAARRPRESS